MQNATEKILIMGVGNDILMDDGVGPRLARFLETVLEGSGIHFATACMGGLEILEFIQGYHSVIFIDAIKTQDGIPGDVYIFNTEDFKETLHLSNLHDTSFITALEVGKRINMQIPEYLKIIAVEIKEDMVFGEAFSTELQARYEEIKETVVEVISELLPQQEILIKEKKN